MGERTIIAWTDHTWNPWMGCHKVSAGCKHCYAETLTKNRMGIDVWGLGGRRQRTRPAVWARPITWNNAAQVDVADGTGLARPHRVFCASLADVFEDEPGPNEWRPEVFEIIRRTPWLDYQLLTKRPENLARMLPDDWGADGWPNVWLGTSIENDAVADRAAILTEVPAIVHFVSYEPAIGPLTMPLNGIEWMIVGGESGPGHRKMDLDWARDMRRRCEERPCDRCGGLGQLRDDAGAAGSLGYCGREFACPDCGATGRDPVAFFFKQDSGHRTEMGIDALGEIVRNYPRSWGREGVHGQAARSPVPQAAAAAPPPTLLD